MLKIIATVLAVLSLAGCVTNRGVCELAPESEGWRHIEARPANVAHNGQADAGRYVAWFQNNSELYLRCERPRNQTGCGEVASFYSVKSGKKLEGMEELIVCHRD